MIGRRGGWHHQWCRQGQKKKKDPQPQLCTENRRVDRGKCVRKWVVFFCMWMKEVWKRAREKVDVEMSVRSVCVVVLWRASRHEEKVCKKSYSAEKTCRGRQPWKTIQKQTESTMSRSINTKYSPYLRFILKQRFLICIWPQKEQPDLLKL